MNFLAHFHVSPALPDAIVGGFLGDFVRGRVENLIDLPETMRHGITLHRKVDAFTDGHPIWLHSASLLAKERRRLAGIVIDVIYDHYLCVHWSKFSDQSLQEFADYCYTCLLSRTQFMELDAQRAVRRMQSHDWLNSYQKREGIALAFHRLSYRSKVLKDIPQAVEDFDKHYKAMESDFLEYYPDLIKFAKTSWSELVE